jgi:hypothetical protein
VIFAHFFFNPGLFSQLSFDMPWNMRKDSVKFLFFETLPSCIVNKASGNLKIVGALLFIQLYNSYPVREQKRFNGCYGFFYAPSGQYFLFKVQTPPPLPSMELFTGMLVYCTRQDGNILIHISFTRWHWKNFCLDNSQEFYI